MKTHRVQESETSYKKQGGDGTMTRPWIARVVCLVILSSLVPAIVMAEDVTVTTYYPSPRGVYNELRTSGNVGIGTTASTLLARLQVEGGAILATGTTGATPAVSGAGTRLMWIPAKAAFRAGAVSGSQWDDGNIGFNTIALGLNAEASGSQSVAIGSRALATGNNSVAIGGLDAALSQVAATGLFSIVLGSNGDLASGTQSIVIGCCSTASGSQSVTIGQWLTASGLDSFVIGDGGAPPFTLANSIDQSLMVGFGSNLPTLFVGPSAGIGTTGNVGIGTAAPASKLTVSGGAAIGTGYTGGVAPADGLIVQGNVGIGTPMPASKLTVSGGAAIGTSYTGPGVAPADGLIVQGNVGIGTMTPSEHLSIGDPGVGLRRVSSNELGVYTSYSQAMRIDPLGHVIINNATDNYSGFNARLVVDGPIQVSTSGGTGWPAYYLENKAAGFFWQMEHLTTGEYVWRNTFGGGPVTRMSLSRTGDLTIYGNMAVAAGFTKNFVIPHPLDPEHKQLVHSSLEGPEAAVYYRGEGWLKDGKAVIELPAYFEALTRKDSRTVLLTPEFAADEPVSQLAASHVADGKFQVRALDAQNPGQKFFWEVKAIRVDVAPLEVERAVRHDKNQ